jgi:hypothetical protein
LATYSLLRSSPIVPTVKFTARFHRGSCSGVPDSAVP